MEFCALEYRCPRRPEEGVRPLQLESQMVVNCSMCGLGTKTKQTNKNHSLEKQ